MDGPLKIAIFSDSALPILNGVSVSIDALVKELRNQGHSVHIFTSSYRGHKDSDPNTHRFLATEFPWTKDYPCAIYPFYPKVFQFRKIGFDIIHTHTPWTLGLVGLRWGQSHQIPVVATYHTLYDKYAHYIPLLPKRYVRYKIAKHTNYYYNHVHQVITPSDASKKWLLRHSVKKPITVIPTSIPNSSSHNREELRKMMGIHPDTQIMLYVGRIAKEKNMALLFEAAQKAFYQNPNLHFWLVGDGPYRKHCAHLARTLGIGDRVKFIGYIPRHEVDQYYAISDLFTFSSITETQGLVVSEAMSYGLPAIVVKGGGAGDAVQDGVNGYLVNNDFKLFSNKIVNLTTNQELYNKLAQGASSSLQYTLPDMAQDVLNIYRDSITNFRREK